MQQPTEFGSAGTTSSRRMQARISVDRALLIPAQARAARTAFVPAPATMWRTRRALAATWRARSTSRCPSRPSTPATRCSTSRRSTTSHMRSAPSAAEPGLPSHDCCLSFSAMQPTTNDRASGTEARQTNRSRSRRNMLHRSRHAVFVRVRRAARRPRSHPEHPTSIFTPVPLTRAGLDPLLSRRRS